ncbi:hypothetical protein [Bacillus atrophaeus]|uniref:hypothetical protein n=1 Tax=Bacillus atrophaeus TaxID=1452 RepID=UPI000D045D03|nr:hypothetical protein [Bacillus atrophaeus]PRR87405.1 hypothetical protein C6W23_18870 [Bacillus atrophaeus]
MNKNELFLELKRQYKDNEDERSRLHKVNVEIRKRIEEICPHTDLYKIDDQAMGIYEGDAGFVKYKCRDCFKYIKKLKGEC